MVVGIPDIKHEKNRHEGIRAEKKDTRQDRHSGDPKSAVHADAKKSGKGGQYTWEGGAGEDFYESDAFGAKNMQNLTMQDPANLKRVEDASMKVDINSNHDFPPLAGKCATRKSPEAKAGESMWHEKVMLDMDFAEKLKPDEIVVITHNTF